MRNNLSKHGIMAFQGRQEIVKFKVIDHFRIALSIDYVKDTEQFIAKSFAFNLSDNLILKYS